MNNYKVAQMKYGDIGSISEVIHYVKADTFYFTETRLVFEVNKKATAVYLNVTSLELLPETNTPLAGTSTTNGVYNNVTLTTDTINKEQNDINNRISNYYEGKVIAKSRLSLLIRSLKKLIETIEDEDTSRGHIN